MFPLGCLIRKNATGIKIFSSPVAALDSADLAMSSGCDVKMYSFIPSGEAAHACHAKPKIAHTMTASFANIFVIAHPSLFQVAGRHGRPAKRSAPRRGGPLGQSASC